MPEEVITPEIARILAETFRELEGEVTLHAFTKKGRNDQFNEVLVNLVNGISRVDGRIKPFFHEIGGEASEKYKVQRSPSLLVSPEKYRIRYTGAPLGEEGRSFIAAVLMASRGKPLLSKNSAKRLEALRQNREVKVFVSPTCPYCPQQAIYAISAAVAMPELVSTEIIEIYENLDLAEKYAAMSVPKTYINGELTAASLEAEDEFISSLVSGESAEAAWWKEEQEEEGLDIVIIGAGPAGLTAAIYAGRSGLKSIVLEKGNVGGQVAITPVVENYPGFQAVPGKTLVDMMLRQAAQYARIKQGVSVKDVRKTDGTFEVVSTGGLYKARAVIIATGASYRKLNVPGEDRLAGRGISYCATCDGYLFKDGKTVAVIGGGNTAVTGALYLDSIGAHVTLIHRTKNLKAEDKLKQSLFQRNIPVLWNTKVDELLGDKKLEKIRVEDAGDGNRRDIRIDGAFIAVGYEPAGELGKIIGLEMDSEGYIRVDEKMRTSVPFVYAAGDVTGSEKQITVAVSQGTLAAITAFEEITKTVLR
ncbi:MAG: FAD-dependent oxidoreductase [Nitrospiraceae bacterium]|nr:FAD-dependent oxidoreductase [Nitrospiraceae bacterium]